VHPFCGTALYSLTRLVHCLYPFLPQEAAISLFGIFINKSMHNLICVIGFMPYLSLGRSPKVCAAAKRSTWRPQRDFASPGSQTRSRRLCQRWLCGLDGCCRSRRRRPLPTASHQPAKALEHVPGFRPQPISVFCKQRLCEWSISSRPGVSIIALFLIVVKRSNATAARAGLLRAHVYSKSGSERVVARAAPELWQQQPAEHGVFKVGAARHGGSTRPRRLQPQNLGVCFTAWCERPAEPAFG